MSSETRPVTSYDHHGSGVHEESLETLHGMTVGFQRGARGLLWIWPQAVGDLYPHSIIVIVTAVQRFVERLG